MDVIALFAKIYARCVSEFFNVFRDFLQLFAVTSTNLPA